GGRGFHRIDREERLAVPFHAGDAEGSGPGEGGFSNVERAILTEGETVVADAERRAIKEGHKRGLEISGNLVIQHADEPWLVHLTEQRLPVKSLRERAGRDDHRLGGGIREFTLGHVANGGGLHFIQFPDRDFHRVPAIPALAPDQRWRVAIEAILLDL